MDPRDRALDEFLAGIEKRAYRMALIATRQREEALDLVQDAMITLASRYGDRQPAEWPPLFHRILQNAVRDWYRRQRVRSIVGGWFGKNDEDAAEPDIPDSLQEPSRAVSNAEDVAAVEAAIQRLPLRQQQALLLRTWEELDVATTAGIMGCSEGSVKTHLSRALAALKSALGNSDENG